MVVCDTSKLHVWLKVKLSTDVVGMHKRLLSGT